MKRFSLIGLGGYIAPRHIKAIRDTGNVLVAALDKNDSVGIIDSYFPDVAFFTEFERFERHIEKLRRTDQAIDYVTVCSPNYLHDSHIRFALRSGADAICEKPLVLNPWNLDALKDIEKESGKTISTILQLRLHPAIIRLRDEIRQSQPNKKHDVDLTYITGRGNWYYTSWKGDINKSGGIATNIGIHFFDMLTWIFGDVRDMQMHVLTHDRAAGILELDKARIRWFLSINTECLPDKAKNQNRRTYRSIQVDGKEIEFSEGFTDLHTASYEAILNGQGFGLEDARKSVEIVHNIRHAEPAPMVADFHPLAKFPLSKHPFSS